MAKECDNDDTLTIQFPGERVFLKQGAAQSIFYVFQQLERIRGINQFENYSSQPQATTVNIKASLREVGSALFLSLGLLLTRGLTNRLPVTLNIRDNPKGVHTERKRQIVVWESQTYTF